MKKTVMAVLYTPFLITGLILGIIPQAFADRTTDVVMINCSVKFSDVIPGPPFPTPEPEEYVVFVSSSSAGAPVVAKGTDCAQAMADVLSAGFELRRVKGTQSHDLNYILIKNKRLKNKK